MTEQPEIDLQPEIEFQAEIARMAITMARYAAALTAICDETSAEACRRLAYAALQESLAHSHVIPEEDHPPHSAYVAQALEAIDATIDVKE